MNDPFDSLTLMLSDVILPNLKTVQSSQSEQIAANDRLEQAIDELRTHLESQFTLLGAQVTALQAELAATQAALRVAQLQAGVRSPQGKFLIH